MNESSGIRAATTAAVLLVAAIAAVVSYIHIEHLAVTHRQTALATYLLPLSIDGTVAAASLVLLRAARAGLSAPWLAQAMLGLAVVATLAANIAYGARYGLAGAAAVGLAGGRVHRLGRDGARHGTARPPGRACFRHVPSPVPSDAETAALASLRATLAAGNPLSQNQLMERFGLTRAQAARVRQAVAASVNGHAHLTRHPVRRATAQARRRACHRVTPVRRRTTDDM